MEVRKGIRGGLPLDAVLEQIAKIARNHQIEKVVLFGSRARGDHREVSDYDIAVFEQALTDDEQAQLCDEIDDIPTLKKIQVVFVRKSGTKELLENIHRDGVVIYEQIRSETSKF
jgi:uncharacterized protein